VAKDALFGPDGTQDPPPPPVSSDPLAGLVTGAAEVSERAAAPPPVAEAPGAPEVDSSMREAIDAALAQERRRTGRQPARQPRRSQPQSYGRPTHQPASRAGQPPAPARDAGRKPNATGCLVALLILVLAIVFGAGRMIVDLLSHVFH
jgi:hypothetical protein